MSGLQISDMTDSLTVFPDGAFIPLVVTSNTGGLVTTENYRYNAGLYLAKLSTLAAATGATLIGSAGPSTVQDDIDALEAVNDLGPAIVPLFRLAGATDDNAAFAAALATGRPVYMPEGQGTGAGGAYQIETPNGTTNVTTNAQIFGDGIGKTVIKRPSSATGSFQFFIDSGSSSVGNNLTNIYFHDLTIEDTNTFSEFQHEMWLGGVTDFLLERVEFKGFRGDGLYVGSGNNDPSTTERHNLRVTVRDCIFDGVNNANRNGVTIIDCDGFLADNCTFVNCTKTDGTMPGPITCEVDANAFHVVRNIRSTNCKFKSCGGFAFALNLKPQTFPATPYEQFTFDNFEIQDCYAAFSLNGFSTTGALSAVNSYDLTVQNGLIKGCTQTVARFDGAFGVKVLNNQFEDNPGIQFGFATGATNRQIAFAGNTYIRCGTGGQVFQQSDDIVDVSVSDFFLDCGKTDGTQGWIWFTSGANADVTGLHLDHCTVSNPSSKTTAFARVTGGYAGTVDSTSTKIGNVLPSLGTADNLILSGVGPDFLQGSAVVDVASISAGRAGTASVTVTGAAVGDFVMGVSGSTALDSGLVFGVAEVTATNTVTVQILNPTAGSIDPASRTYYATVRKRLS